MAQLKRPWYLNDTTLPAAAVRLDFFRAAGEVKRCHTERVLRPQTVAQHSWGVATILLMVHPEADAKLLRAALWHDVSERAMGDIPSPVKWASEEMHAAIEALEDDINKQWDIMPKGLTEAERALLKFCDAFEFYLWTREEIAMGNTFMFTPRQNITAFLTHFMQCRSSESMMAYDACYQLWETYHG